MQRAAAACQDDCRLRRFRRFPRSKGLPHRPETDRPSTVRGSPARGAGKFTSRIALSGTRTSSFRDAPSGLMNDCRVMSAGISWAVKDARKSQPDGERHQRSQRTSEPRPTNGLPTRPEYTAPAMRMPMTATNPLLRGSAAGRARDLDRAHALIRATRADDRGSDVSGRSVVAQAAAESLDSRVGHGRVRRCAGSHLARPPRHRLARPRAPRRASAPIRQPPKRAALPRRSCWSSIRRARC